MNEGTHTKYNEEHMGGDLLYVKTNLYILMYLEMSNFVC